ncbi:MAG: phosphoribosylformylglycinamidine cyclo-ligase [Chloroflexi bacterium]|nr:phosphoribosylformylglycinamidine cyclo-ligase [Chloroflexota bacterium]
MINNKYKEAGVDIDAAAELTEQIKDYARATRRPEVLSGPGFFGGMFELKGHKNPVLVSSADGVGTKLAVADAMEKHDSIGIDLVNHCINDILTTGAEPLFFLDYMASGKLNATKIADVVKGLAYACGQAGCTLLGGETAEMPGLYQGEDYDLAGFIVGVVEKDNILPAKDIREGDIVLGLPSSGLHTNGYSLARRVLGQSPAELNKHYPQLGKKLGEELLEPHRCYYKELKPLLKQIKALAHITGGGLVDNLPRCLPDGLSAQLDSSSWQVPPIFRLIQEKGDVSESEMYRVFNMGVGMALICSEENIPVLQSKLPQAKRIGKLVKQVGEERVIIN